MMMRTMLPRLTRFVYILGTVMLLAGMVLSVVTVPVKASATSPQVGLPSGDEDYQPITIPVCKNVTGGYELSHYHLNIPSDYENGLLKWKSWIWAPFVFYGVERPGQGDQSLLRNGCVPPTETPTEPPTDTPTVTETPTETLTETPTETLTETPTETLTETPTETPTETLTETPTETLTETPTETPEIVDLEISFICSPLFSTREAEATVVWSVYNPNDFEISFTWTLDGGLPGSGKVLGLSSLESYATSTTGVHTMLVTWTYDEATYSTTYTTPANCCQEETKTPTKPPVTPTDPPVVTEETQVTRGTLAPPVVEGGPVLIPVTGDDQSIAPMGSISFGSLFSNLGMMFLGIGLVLTAINKKLHL